MEADCVIIGSGSAGVVMAARLSEDGCDSVPVLEHGGSDIGPLIQMPGARQASKPPTPITATSRKASERWSRRSGKAGTGRRRVLI